MEHRLNDHLDQQDRAYEEEGERPVTLIDRMMREARHEMVDPLDPNEINTAFIQGCDFLERDAAPFGSFQPEHVRAIEYLDQWSEDQIRVWQSLSKRKKVKDD